MRDEPEDKMPPTSFSPTPILALAIAVLLVIVGTVSFIYSNGWQLIRHGWFGWLTPAIELTVSPESTTIPADGSSQTLVNITATNREGQLLDGDNIVVSVSRGETDITNTVNPPSDVSRQISVRSPGEPQIIVLSISFRHLTETLTLEAFDPRPPATPSIKAPASDAILSTATPVVSGQSPVGVDVEIYTDDALNTVTTPDNDGVFNTNLEVALARGRHKLVVASINQYGIRSQLSDPIYIEIQTPDPKIDFDNIRLKPDPVSPGEAAYIFIPTSENTQSVVVTLDGTEYPLSDRNNSSVFSGVMRAPTSSGLYRLSALIVNEGGNSVLINNIAALRVR